MEINAWTPENIGSKGGVGGRFLWQDPLCDGGARKSGFSPSQFPVPSVLRAVERQDTYTERQTSGVKREMEGVLWTGDKLR